MLEARKLVLVLTNGFKVSNRYYRLSKFVARLYVEVLCVYTVFGFLRDKRRVYFFTKKLDTIDRVEEWMLHDLFSAIL